MQWDPRPAVCVVLTSQGYPGNFTKGKVITGLAEAASLPDVKVFHAATKLENGLFVTDGGRVLGVTALGDTIAGAQRKAYNAVKCIHFQGMHYRKDIGERRCVRRLCEASLSWAGHGTPLRSIRRSIPSRPMGVAYRVFRFRVMRMTPSFDLNSVGAAAPGSAPEAILSLSPSSS